MNIVFFSHPAFLGSESMPRFSRMLMDGMRKRGWNVALLQPEAILSRIPAPPLIRKWLGYFDQYIIFPMLVKKKVKRCATDTLFVFTDHALGPWVPLASHRPHVIHCHDFLAQKSAKGLIKEHPTALLGRCYQWYIRRGYTKGLHFISVSKKTQEDLHTFLSREPHHSAVVYNGMNRPLRPHDPAVARVVLGKYTGLDLSDGYVLHVGGNQWYKNRAGVIDIYDAWRSSSEVSLPLMMVGKPPDKELRRRYEASPFRADIHMVTDLPDELIPLIYSGAALLLFPSLAEGFGWPVAEAMACGCPVVTTDTRPMTEVAGGTAFLIRTTKGSIGFTPTSINDGAQLIRTVLELRPHEREKVVAAGLANAKRFDTDHSLDQINKVYKSVLSSYTSKIEIKDEIDELQTEQK
jgi:glycosyltransferase involved in cell wall biosynthesis